MCAALLWGTACSKSPEETETTPEPEQTTETAESSQPAEKDDFTVGTVDGTVYTNEAMKFRMELPEGWVYATREELAELNQMVIDSFTDESLKASIENGGAVMGVFATAPDGRNQVNIMFQKLPLSGYKPETIIDQSIPAVQKELEGQGFADPVISREPISFLGEDTYCMKVKGSLNGITLYETQVYIQEGRYLAALTFVSVGEDHTEELISTVSRTK